MVVVATYRIGGMTCASCSSTVEKHIKSLDGTISANVNLLLNEAEVLMDPLKLSPDQVAEAIETIGFDATLTSSRDDGQPTTLETQTINTRLKLAVPSAESVHELTAVLKQYQGVHEVVIEDPVGSVLLVTHLSTLTPKQIYLIARAVSDVPVSLLDEDQRSGAGYDGGAPQTADQQTSATLRLQLMPDSLKAFPNLESSTAYIDSLTGVIRSYVDHSAGVMEIEYLPLVISVRALFHEALIVLQKDAPQLSVSVLSDPPPIDSGRSEEMMSVKHSAMMCALPACLILWISMTPSSEEPAWFTWQVLPGISVCVLLLFALATPIQWIWGKEIHQRAWKSLKNGHITMDTFISFNTSFCYVASVLLMILAICTSSYDTDAIQAFRQGTSKLPLPSAEHLYAAYRNATASGSQPEKVLSGLQGNGVVAPPLTLDQHEPTKDFGDANLPHRISSIRGSLTSNHLPNAPPGNLSFVHDPSWDASASRPPLPPPLTHRRDFRGMNSGNLPVVASRRLGIKHVGNMHPEHGVPHYFETSALLITVVLAGKVCELSAKRKTLRELELLNSTKGAQASIVRRVQLHSKEASTTKPPDDSSEDILQSAASPSVSTSVSSVSPFLRYSDNINDPYRVRYITEKSVASLKQFRTALRQIERIAKPPLHPSYDDVGKLQVLPGQEYISEWIQSLSQSLEGGGAEKLDFAMEVELVECCSSLVQPGDLLRVEAGQKIPADGIVITSDEAMVDESLISGESLPVSKKTGDRALEGSVVYSPELYLVVSHVGKGSVLGQVIDTVRMASACSTPIGVIADRICSFFLPGAFLLAVMAWSAWAYLVWSGLVNPFEDQIVPTSIAMRKAVEFMFIMKFGISVLAIACPCALGLATPTATTVATGKAVSFGVLIKNGSALEIGGNAKNIVLDKTGTLTAGKPSVLSAYMRIDAFHKIVAPFLSEVRLAESETTAIDITNDLGTSWATDRTLPASEVARTAYVVDRAQVAPSDTRTVDLLWAVWWRILELVEAGMPHPVAEAICNHLRCPGFPFHLDSSSRSLFDIDSKSTIGGKGVMARIQFNSKGSFFEEEGTQSFDVLCGSLTYCQSIARANHLQVFDDMESDAWLQEGVPSTVVCLFTEKGILLGALKLHDDVLPYSAQAVAMLQQKYGKKVWMCTGDNDVIAKAVAHRVGIPESQVVSGASPWKKKDLIMRLSRKSQHFSQFLTVDTDKEGKTGRGVIMVGDGSNDSLALVESDVGVAVGAGTNITALAADVILIKHDLEALLSLIKLSRRTRSTIKRNFLWAFIFNVVGLPVAAGVLYPHVEISPLWSGFAMACSSLIVILNSILLFLVKPISLKDSPSRTLTWRQKLRGWFKLARHANRPSDERVLLNVADSNVPPFTRPDFRI